MRLTILLCFLPLIASVVANVEKTIFIAPEAIDIPPQHPNLDDLHLDVLTPENPTLRTWLPASFRNPPNTRGTTSWFLLENLQQTQRHEVRICWPATVSDNSLFDCSSLKILEYVLCLTTFVCQGLPCSTATDRFYFRHIYIVGSVRHARAHHVSCFLFGEARQHF